MFTILEPQTCESFMAYFNRYNKISKNFAMLKQISKKTLNSTQIFISISFLLTLNTWSLNYFGITQEYKIEFNTCCIDQIFSAGAAPNPSFKFGHGILYTSKYVYSNWIVYYTCLILIAINHREAKQTKADRWWPRGRTSANWQCGHHQ